MPKRLNPNTPVNFVLKSDRDLPEGEQPTFKLKVLAIGAFNQYLELQEKIGTAENTFKASAESLCFALESWSNMGDAPVSVESIMSILTPSELNEVNKALADLNELTIEEKKA